MKEWINKMWSQPRSSYSFEHGYMTAKQKALRVYIIFVSSILCGPRRGLLADLHVCHFSSFGTQYKCLLFRLSGRLLFDVAKFSDSNNNNNSKSNDNKCLIVVGAVSLYVMRFMIDLGLDKPVLLAKQSK